MFEWLFSEKRDELTIIEWAKTNQRDFAHLYDLYVHRVYNFVRRRVANNEDAEDIVSETFMAAAMRIQDYDHKKWSFTTWLFSIAHHKFLDKMRVVYVEKDVNTQIDDIYEVAYEKDYIQLLSDRQLYERIIAFVKTLPDRQSSLFFLRYVEWLPNKELAEIYDIDERTVSSTLSHVCAKIKKWVWIM